MTIPSESKGCSSWQPGLYQRQAGSLVQSPDSIFSFLWLLKAGGWQGDIVSCERSSCTGNCGACRWGEDSGICSQCVILPWQPCPVGTWRWKTQGAALGAGCGYWEFNLKAANPTAAPKCFVFLFLTLPSLKTNKQTSHQAQNTQVLCGVLSAVP